MSTSSVVIPTNTNRYNEYREWDRGLILLDETHEYKVARVKNAYWSTRGDIMSPGVLSYRMEYFSLLPSTAASLAEFKVFEDTQPRTCITRGMCDNPIMIEAFAVQHFLRNVNDATEERIEHVNTVASNMMLQLSKGVIKDLTVSLSFSNTSLKPLELTSAVVEYIAELEHEDGSKTTLQDTLMPDFNKIRPLYLVLDDIKQKTAP